MVPKVESMNVARVAPDLHINGSVEESEGFIDIAGYATLSPGYYAGGDENNDSNIFFWAARRC